MKGTLLTLVAASLVSLSANATNDPPNFVTLTNKSSKDVQIVYHYYIDDPYSPQQANPMFSINKLVAAGSTVSFQDYQGYYPGLIVMVDKVYQNGGYVATYPNNGSAVTDNSCYAKLSSSKNKIVLSETLKCTTE